MFSASVAPSRAKRADHTPGRPPEELSRLDIKNWTPTPPTVESALIASLECPFHAWRYDGEEGVVKDIPYAKAIPPQVKRKCLRTWPVTEANYSL